jgi:hypothetical protein
MSAYSRGDGGFRDSDVSILSSEAKKEKTIENNPNIDNKLTTHAQVQPHDVFSGGDAM